MVQAMNSRSSNLSLFTVGFLKNRILLIAISTSVLIHVAIVYIPFLSDIFQTTPLFLADWLLVAVVSLSVFVVAEIMKLLIRRRKPKEPEPVLRTYIPK